MLELTFGEQVKIVLNRKDMTIKQLAEMIEERTGKKMSRQNLTQRLARDNFQEQDMRLIASILECPFHLSILEENADSEYTTRENIKIDKRAENNIIIDEEPQQLTLNLEYDEPEQVQEEQPVKAREFGISGAERDITIGELVDIHKDLDQMEETSEYADQTEYEESAEYEEPAEYEESAEYEEEPQSSEVPEYNKQEDVKDILEEMAAIEAEEKKAREDREEREREKEQEKEQEKPRGWRAYFPRRKKKQAEAVHEDKQEAATEQLEAESAMNQAQPEDKTEEAVSEEPYQESEEYQEPKEYQEAEEHQEPEEYQEAEEYQEEEQAYEEYVEENQQDMEEEFADTAQDWEAPEEENVGDINPYTGMEYESNSVRMHPKRIGYVQVYDRSDHQWTDMTEWAFLGYQERKKALLGKDYEPPIYLD